MAPMASVHANSGVRPRYDAIVVGARCAGSATAMLLARRGHRVLLLDRARFPSDTTSTHLLQPTGAAALARWGLLDRLVATGCPPISTYAFDFGPFTVEGAPGTPEQPVAFCPRRTVLDALLVRAAADAGAEVREAFPVEELVFEDGRVVGVRGRSSAGGAVVERARVVVGADGRGSLVARAVRSSAYDARPPYLFTCYAYFSGLPTGGRYASYLRPRRALAAVPTHDGLTVVIAAWPADERRATPGGVERQFLEAIARAPALADRVRAARRESRFAGARVESWFRRPHGPGWVLVGDAGYEKDPISAQGISDAFQDAERCATALDGALTGARALEEAMDDAWRARDAQAQAMYAFTCRLATLEPPSPDVLRFLAEIVRQGHQRAMDGFARANAGTISPAAFFSGENIRAILASGSGAPAAG